jgi:hypothetical protein
MKQWSGGVVKDTAGSIGPRAWRIDEGQRREETSVMYAYRQRREMGPGDGERAKG